MNFTNPSGMITEAVIKHMGWKKCIGLCNVPTYGYGLCKIHAYDFLRLWRRLLQVIRHVNVSVRFTTIKTVLWW